MGELYVFTARKVCMRQEGALASNSRFPMYLSFVYNHVKLAITAPL